MHALQSPQSSSLMVVCAVDILELEYLGSEGCSGIDHWLRGH